MGQAITVILPVEAVVCAEMVHRLHVGEVIAVIYLSLPIKRQVHIHPYIYPTPQPIINYYESLLELV
jgi:hypothetical protein